jgi:hypothetical protein
LPLAAPTAYTTQGCPATEVRGPHQQETALRGDPETPGGGRGRPRQHDAGARPPGGHQVVARQEANPVAVDGPHDLQRRSLAGARLAGLVDGLGERLDDPDRRARLEQLGVGEHDLTAEDLPCEQVDLVEAAVDGVVGGADPVGEVGPGHEQRHVDEARVGDQPLRPARGRLAARRGGTREHGDEQDGQRAGQQGPGAGRRHRRDSRAGGDDFGSPGTS